jgi:hypothetical protein
MLDMVGVVKQSEWFDDELSQAGAVLPVQFHNARVDNATAEPLRRLMVAILVDAIRCFQTKLALRQPARRQEFARYGPGSSQMSIMGVFLSERSVTRSGSIRKLSENDSRNGKK